MGNTALTRAFFKHLSLLTKDEEITSKCSKLDYRREEKKNKLPSLYSAKRKKPAMSCTMYKNVCILRVILYQACVPLWEFHLQKNCRDCSAKSIEAYGPTAFPRNSCCFAYSFWLWSLKRVHRGAKGSDFPSHLLLQKKKGVWSSPLKTLQTELDHKPNHITHKTYTHKNATFLTPAIKIFKAIYNQIQSNICKTQYKWYWSYHLLWLR